MHRKPYTVQVRTARGGWTSDATSRHLDRVRDRLLWITRSPRGRTFARIVDADGRTVAA